MDSMKNKSNFCRSIIAAVLNGDGGHYIHPSFSGKTLTEILSLCREWYKEKVYGRRMTSLEYNWTEIRNYSTINHQLFDSSKIQSDLAICIQINSSQMCGWFIFDAKTLEVVSK